jgi:hypothetical protein
MDIRGIQRIQAFLGGIIDGRQRPVNASNDRDAHRDQLQQRRRYMKLSKEQVDEAFSKLIEGLEGTGLVAEQIAVNNETHFVVKDKTNAVVRELKGLMITDLYLKKFEEGDTSGTLLKRSA